MVIHLRPGELRGAFGEIRRVLRPRELSLAAFHAGSEVRRLGEWWGHAVDVDFRFYEPQAIAEAMKRAGLRTEMHPKRWSYPRGGRDAPRLPAGPAPALNQAGHRQNRGKRRTIFLGTP